MIETDKIKIVVDDSSVERAGKKVLKLSDTLKVLRGNTVSVDSRFIKLGEGLTKSQAAMLAALKQSGANIKQMKDYAKILEQMNKFSGVNPFDKTTNPLGFVKKQKEELEKSIKLSEKYNDLTKEQVALVSRGMEFARQKAKADNLNFGQREAYVKKYTADMVTEMRAQNAITDSIKQQNAAHAHNLRVQEQMRKAEESRLAQQKELTDLHQKNLAGNIGRQEDKYRKEVEAWQKAEEKKLQAGTTMMDQAVVQFRNNEIEKTKIAAREQENRNKQSVLIGPDLNAYNKSLNDKAKATNAATIADERLEFQIKQLQAGLTVASANQLYKYKEALIKAGNETDVVTQKTNDFQKKLLARQNLDPTIGTRQGIQHTSRELDRLARGLSVQMGDVAVSLASGMNPLMVMIQQGDQIRGLITQSGVEGKELSKSMSLAAGQIASSFKGTALAIGGFFTGAIVSAGKSASDLALKTAGLNTTLDQLIVKYGIAAGAGDKFAAVQLRILKLVPTIAGSLIALSAVIAGSLLVALYQVTKQEDALAKQLALTGGSLGMNQNAALEYAKSLNDVGISTSKAVDVITAMAKEGEFAASEIKMIALAASDMSKYFDISIEDTVKSFAKLKSEPTKALAEIAKATGMVTEETLKAVQELERQGKYSDAAALAMKAYADVQVQQVQRVKAEYSDFAMFFIELGSQISNFWNNTIKGSLYKVTPTERLKSEIKDIDELLEGVSGKLLGDTGRKYWEGVRSELTKQLLVQEKAADMQQQRQVEQSKAASDVLETEKLRVKSLTDIETKQEEINRLTNEIKTNSGRWGIESEHVLTRQKLIKKLEQDIAEIQNKGKGNKSRSSTNDNSSLLKQVTDAYTEQFGAVSNLTKAEIDFQKMQAATDWSKLSKEQQMWVRQTYAMIAASQEYTKSEQEKGKAQDLINNLLGRAEGKGKAYQTTLDALVDAGKRFPELAADIELAKKALEDTTPAAKANTAAKKALADTLDANTLALDNEYASLMLEQEALLTSAEAHKRKVGMLQVEIQYQKELAAVQDAISKGLTDPAEIEKRLLQAVGNKAKAEDLLEYKVRLEFSDDFKRLKAYSDMFQSAMDGMADTIADFAKTGKMNFGNLIDNMIADIIRLEIKLYTSKMMNQYGGVSGIIGSLFGSWDGGNPANAYSQSFNTSALTNPTLQAKGGVWDSGIQAFAKGGTFTNSIVDSPTLFKFAKGTGLMGEAGPEAIMPLKRGADGSLGVVNNSGSSANVEVIINNNSTAQATATETTDARGNRRIEVTIGDMVASEVGRAGSSTQKSLTNNFGLKQQLIRR